MPVFKPTAFGQPPSLVKTVRTVEKYVIWGLASMEWKIVVLCGKSVLANYIVGVLLSRGPLYRMHKIFVKNRKANP